MAVKIPQLESLLRRTGRLGLQTAALSGLARLLAVTLAAALTAIALDAAFALEAETRIVVDVLAVASVAGGLIFIAQAVARQRYEPRRIARLIELRRSIHDNRLINAFDLATQGDSAGSAALREMALEQGETLAARISPRQVIDRGPMRRAGSWALAGLLAFALASLAMPRVFTAVIPRYFQPLADHPPYTALQFAVAVDPQPVHQNRPAEILARLSGPTIPQRADVVFIEGDARTRQPMSRAEDGRFSLRIERAESSRVFYIDTPAGRSRRCLLTVDPAPHLEQISVTYDFPPYTRWPSRREELGRRDGSIISALEGSRVTLTVQSNMALQGGQLLLTPADAKAGPQSISLQPDAADPTRAAGSFKLAFSGRYELSIASASGVPGGVQPVGALNCLPDAPPTVRIADPAAEEVRSPVGWKIPLTITAEDDVAVERIELHQQLNGSAVEISAIAIDKPGQASVRGQAWIDLAAPSIKAGDVIRCVARAIDNAPPPRGPQATDSRALTIHVISPEDFAAQTERSSLMQRMDRLSRQMNGLNSRREALVRQLQEWHKTGGEDRGGDAGQAERQALGQAVGQYAQKSRELSEQLAQESQARPGGEAQREMAEACRNAGRCAAGQASAAEKLKQALGSGLGTGAGGGGSLGEAMDGFLGESQSLKDGAAALQAAADKAAGNAQQPREARAGVGRGAHEAKLIGPEATTPSGTTGTGSRGEAGAAGADGRQIVSRDEPGRAAESLNPQTASNTSAGAASLAGVPARYRAAAEAYFRRLAEESR